MEYFTGRGRFWLPDNPQRAIPGTLTFDSDGTSLRLEGSLHAFELRGAGVKAVTAEPMTVPFVHGLLWDGKEVTLLAVGGPNTAGPDKVISETWWPSFALTGGYLADDLFERASFEFDVLAAWADPPSLLVEAEDENVVAVDRTRVTLLEGETADGSVVRLISGGKGTWSDDHVHLDRQCWLEASGEPRTLRDILDHWTRPLENLLIVALGRPVRLTSLCVTPSGLDSSGNALSVSFKAIQPAPSTPASEAEILTYTAPTLLTGRDRLITSDELVKKWFATYERLGAAIALVCAPFHAPFIFSEHRYASTIQAAEGLATELFDPRQKPRPEHRQRLEAVADAIEAAGIDPETKKWAISILTNRNDTPLRAKIEELTNSTGSVGDTILKSIPGFPREVTRARVGVSHGGAPGSEHDRQYWLGAVLTWVVRVKLLAETGVPLDHLTSVTTKNPDFKRALRELGDPA